MKSFTFLKVFALASLFLAACQPNEKQDSSEIAKESNDRVLDDRDNEKDADFVVNQVASNIADINLSQLALTKSSNTEVKKMATMLEAEHTKVLRSLQGYATTKGISIPTSETNEAMKDREDLMEVSGNDFDEKWCNRSEESHKESIRKYESRIDKTEDAGLKNLLSSTLPNLKNHLVMLEKYEENKK